MRRKAELSTATNKPKQTRDRHGSHRGLPPPAVFSLAEMPDDGLLTESEAAAAARISRNTLQAWRRLPNHALPWTVIHGGRIRYTAGDLKRFLGSGSPHARKPAPAMPPSASESDAALARRRAPRRARARADNLGAAPAESSS